MSLDPDVENRCRASFARQAAMATLDASIVSVGAGACEIGMPFSAKFTQQHGFIHAGVISMLADTACGFAALSLMPEDAAVMTTEFKINLLAREGRALRCGGPGGAAGQEADGVPGRGVCRGGRGAQAGCADDRLDDGHGHIDRP